MVRDAATGSGGFVLYHAFGRPGLAWGKIGGVAIQRRAVGADDLVVVTEVEKNVRVIERRIGAYAHEFLRSDLDDRNPGVIVKVRNDVIGHFVLPVVVFTVVAPIPAPSTRRRTLGMRRTIRVADTDS
jgi:hypothetical protein